MEGALLPRMTVSLNTNGTPRAPTADERRIAERSLVEAEISVASDSQFFTGLAGNISTGGVFMATYRLLPIGAPVTLRMALPEGEVLATGTVRWVREASTGATPGLGVAFDGPLGGDTLQRILRFCAIREPLLHDDD
jgi:uncharacterized protein (TIGR02266 family)